MRAPRMFEKRECSEAVEVLYHYLDGVSRAVGEWLDRVLRPLD